MIGRRKYFSLTILLPRTTQNSDGYIGWSSNDSSQGYNPNKYSNGRVCNIDLEIIPFSVLVPGHDILSILRHYYIMYNNLIFWIIYIHTIILLECLWKLNICCYQVVQINVDWIIYSCTRATSEVQHFIFRTLFITIVYVIITLITLHFI